MSKEKGKKRKRSSDRWCEIEKRESERAIFLGNGDKGGEFFQLKWGISKVRHRKRDEALRNFERRMEPEMQKLRRGERREKRRRETEKFREKIALRVGPICLSHYSFYCR